ncbi:unnamed protein product [Schistocephalus solidus]|uniref:Uncharacterized protein n=1 Tax=Schistocephalus solidus TaxID=70667 RepID=A0A183SR46_SCHSO|nr:unnamed protein product [Schistocephalus solidus]
MRQSTTQTCQSFGAEMMCSGWCGVKPTPGHVIATALPPFKLFNRNRTLGIGCWNVRTILDPGTPSLTARSLYQYNVDVCYLSEVRIPDSGANSQFTLYLSVPRDSSGRHGVAIALATSEPCNT